MRNYHLQAFTIIELLVVMVLSAIVISFGYLGYGMVQKNYLGFRSSAVRINESAKLQSALSYDVDNCHYLSGDTKELIFVFEKNKMVTYLFLDKVVIRAEGQVRDTIHAEIKNISLKYGQKPIAGNLGQIIDEILLECNLEGEQEIFSYFKLYPADVLMSQEPVDINNQIR
ncbi:MAG: prepilin-type N-terminal cleavage/methylation domain-containing protein [Bacteroidetes bacterium]|nr:prepilin-type N-terminal cleavage/methylation domain-containing protein [Bacteroidota bacterium]